MIVMAPQRQANTNWTALESRATLAELRGWVDRLCAVADEIDARVRESESRGDHSAGADPGGEGPLRDR